MNVMLAAGAKELECGPMIGFDSIGVRTERTAASDGRVLTLPTRCGLRDGRFQRRKAQLRRIKDFDFDFDFDFRLSTTATR